ncbi:MAG: outer membrane lipoprotein-sorting protein [Saprospiraceae bacterium]|nr:outer membrane lipoprotein-sorting protein [Saprospiraceae bacterium]
MKYLLFILMTFSTVSAWTQDATEIIRKTDEKARGVESSQGLLRMTIVRPSWSREIEIKSWSKGRDYSLMLITAPARDQGTAFLKRDKEIWNWQPSIDRAIKLPPSMMMQSWMGSDFTNDDLVRESSIVVDYTHELLGSEIIEGMDCYKIQLNPKPEAPVVWGKVITWIEKKELLQLKTEFYDEDEYLVNTMYGKNVRMLGGRLLPTRLEMVPAEEEGKMTVVEQLDLAFDDPISEKFFSIQNMKRVR